jgi:SAM-dependent methyltransferase
MRIREIYWKMRRVLNAVGGESAQWGNLRRLNPFSKNWGLERGQPIDRFYIEKFLAQFASDVRDNVLEIGDDRYTRQFGSTKVIDSDVLHYEEGNRIATIVDDLTTANSIESNRYDCIICIQTLQYIFDLEAAINSIHRILAPGGVALVTFPGITSMGDKTWIDQWCWSMTPASARLLFGRNFMETNVTIQSFGNLLSSVSFLYGFASRELTNDELLYQDSAYPLIIGVRAKKAQ